MSRRNPPQARSRVLALLVLAAVLPAAETASQQTGEGADADTVRITARVHDVDDRRPLAGAVLSLSGVAARHATGVDGSATFAAALGQYELTVAKGGYETLVGAFSVLRSGEFTLWMSKADVADPGAPARLLVRVLDAESRAPVEGAAVSVLPGGSRPTDGAGRAQFQDLAPSLAQVTVEMIGYARRTEPVSLHPGRTTALDVALTVEAVPLRPIEVVVRLPFLEANGVYRRIDQGVARRLLTRRTIVDRGSHRISDSFAHVPGLQIRRGGGQTGFPSRAVLYARGCPVAVWVDGIEWNPDIEGSVDIDRIPPEWVEIAEVYSQAQAPLQYTSRHGCGVVLIWTRQGRRG